jgi:hypothetical protein
MEFGLIIVAVAVPVTMPIVAAAAVSGARKSI